MRNVELQHRVRGDIDRQVEKVLRGLGNPEPPLRLAERPGRVGVGPPVLLGWGDGVLAEAAHRMRVGVRQILDRPALLLDVVKKLSLKALWIPDRRRILIDADEPPLKHRWNEAHEIGHSIIPWHTAVLHGDNKRTLKRPATTRWRPRPTTRLAACCSSKTVSPANYSPARSTWRPSSG